jgi:hypothetical protein
MPPRLIKVTRRDVQTPGISPSLSGDRSPQLSRYDPCRTPAHDAIHHDASGTGEVLAEVRHWVISPESVDQILQRDQLAVTALVAAYVDPVVVIEDVLECGGDIGLAGSGHDAGVITALLYWSIRQGINSRISQQLYCLIGQWYHQAKGERYMRVFIAALVMVFGLSGEGKAGFIDGNLLNEICQTKNGYDRGTCTGYIMAIIDISEKKPFYGYCHQIPSAATGVQVRDVVKAWLEKHPEVRHLSAHSLVVRTLSETWPCKK